MLQESQTKEESWITLTGMPRFARNTTWIGGQIGLLSTTGVTRMDTWVNGQTRLLETARVTEMDTWVDGQTGLLGIAGATGTVAWVSKQIRLLGSAGVIEIASQSQEIRAELWKIRLTRKAGLQKIGLLWKARLWRIQLTQMAEL
jgi:hypothetical protein